MKNKQQALGLYVSGAYWLASNAILHNTFWHMILLQIKHTIYTPPYAAYTLSLKKQELYLFPAKNSKILVSLEKHMN